MANLQVSPYKMQTMSRNAQNMSNKLQNIKERFENAVRSIDWDIKASVGINRLMNQLNEKIIMQSQLLHEHNKFLEKAFKDYETADKRQQQSTERLNTSKLISLGAISSFYTKKTPSFKPYENILNKLGAAGIYGTGVATADVTKIKNIIASQPIGTVDNFDISKVGERIAKVDTYKSGITGECIWYVRGRAQEKLNISTGVTGDGGEWFEKAVAKNLSTGQTIASDSIACFSGPTKHGHVIYVEKVLGDKVFYTEANVQPPYSNGTISSLDGVLKEISITEFEKKSGNSLQGYIYLEGV